MAQREYSRVVHTGSNVPAHLAAHGTRAAGKVRDFGLRESVRLGGTAEHSLVSSVLSPSPVAPKAKATASQALRSLQAAVSLAADIPVGDTTLGAAMSSQAVRARILKSRPQARDERAVLTKNFCQVLQSAETIRELVGDHHRPLPNSLDTG